MSLTAPDQTGPAPRTLKNHGDPAFDPNSAAEPETVRKIDPRNLPFLVVQKTAEHQTAAATHPAFRLRHHRDQGFGEYIRNCKVANAAGMTGRITGTPGRMHGPGHAVDPDILTRRQDRMRIRVTGQNLHPWP